MKRLLVIEDGSEYAEFARSFLPEFEVIEAKSAADSIAALERSEVDLIFVDLRFERVDPAVLVGDIGEIATRLFGGDRARAVQYLMDQQGALVLGEIRGAGCMAPALFVQDFPPRRLANLKRLYGDVRAVPRFDVAMIRAALAGSNDG